MGEVALRFAASGRVDVHLPRDPSCASEARDLLQGCVDPEMLAGEPEDAVLIASELATNAYRHGRGSIVLTLERLADRLRITVTDDGEIKPPAAVRPDLSAGGGRGLWIVSQLADSWGVTPGTAQVWAELALESS